MKKCNCCNKIYESRPMEAKLDLGSICPGYYFNCACGSTLVFRLGKELEKAIFTESENSIKKLHAELMKVS